MPDIPAFPIRREGDLESKMEAYPNRAVWAEVSAQKWRTAGGMSGAPAGLVAMTGARSGGRRSSGSRPIRGRRSQIGIELLSDEMSDFRATGGPQIGPLSWRLGPPGTRTYPPRVAIFARKPPCKTPDLGMPPIIPKSGVLDGGFGAKMATSGGYVRDPGGPSRHGRGPIWGPPVARKSADPGEKI